MELLEKHFDTAFAAPDGIQKLRELILTLAMQGKLVPQDPNDQPASELLKEIEAEKQRLVKEGKIKRPKPLPSIQVDEIAFDLPKGWEQVRLGEVVNFTTGKLDSNAAVKNDQYPFFTCAKEALLIDHYAFDCETILLAGNNAAGKYNVKHYKGKFNAYQRTYIITVEFGRGKVIDYGYLKYLLENMLDDLQSKSLGTLTQFLTLGILKPILISLPPLAEQHRIVAKIDQLMTRCDELEKLRGDRNQKRITIHTAALDRLLTAKESSDFSTAWRFITQHFGELYSVKENVAELRKAILQLAVMGKLVPQDPKDEPASELLKAIEAEKQQLVKEGKVKQSKLLSGIEPEEVSYELPKGWKWTRFGDIANLRLGKMLDGSKNRGTPRPYLRNTNVQWHLFEMTDIKQMKFEDKELDEFRVMPGDLLICEGGEPGRCAIWSDPSQEIYFQKALHRARAYGGVAGEYLQICLTIDAMTENLNKYFTGATIKHFPGEKLSKYIVPLPPISEQHRIVAKVDQLMTLCGELEQQIDAATSKRTELLNALMAQV